MANRAASSHAMVKRPKYEYPKMILRFKIPSSVEEISYIFVTARVLDIFLVDLDRKMHDIDEATMLGRMAPISTCRLKAITSTYACIYCFSLSVIFVVSLYILVPPNVRELERSDPRQIKWRVFAVTTVCIAATLSFPFLFCSSDDRLVDVGNSDDSSVPTASQLLGWTLPFHSNSIQLVFGVLMHAILLYTGPMFNSLLYTYHVCKRMGLTREDITYIETFRLVYIQPIMSAERWSTIRNLLVAPLSEEIVFRGCMVPVLLASGMRPLRAVWMAPLFFGTAHFHHAWLRYKQGVSLSNVLLSTLFQFAYTTLFGSYTSFAYIRTNSIVAITTCHAFCNLMGLPDISFLQNHGARYSVLHSYRWLLIGIYFIGIAAFVLGFQSTNIIPPSPGILVEAIDNCKANRCMNDATDSDILGPFRL